MAEKKKTLMPAVKWSGSKRSQAERILGFFPVEIGTYWEPFCGGCSVLAALVADGRPVRRYVCSDANPDLISLWTAVRDDPDGLWRHYSGLWEALQISGFHDGGRALYERVRERFNGTRNPYDFLFVDRTCFNGLIRYNSKGEFNSPYHLNRGGIHPDKLRGILLGWSEMLKEKSVEFICTDYRGISPEEGDFVYLDPPYANTKGMYSSVFDNTAMFSWMRGLPCGWALSYDGVSGGDDSTYPVPEYLYSKHVYVESGNSSFKRIKTTDKGAVVYESLYIK